MSATAGTGWTCSPAARRALLALARRAITARVNGAPPPAPDDADLPPIEAGAFVTIEKGGELRGCIGSLETDRPVGEVVAHVAAAAATEDPRFPPVRPAELGLIDLEISVLGPLEPVEPPDPSRVVVGRHGLVVERGLRRGLLLPQVAVEWHWDAETFLAQTCVKAGLPRDAWRTGARVFRFVAEVFGERDEPPVSS
jgi:AmmeMemoRadiSam system protein A